MPEFINTIISNFLNSINAINITIFLINLIILLFWKYIITYLDTSEFKRGVQEDTKNKKLKTLQFINALLAITYFFALFLDKEIFQSIILSLFTVLIAYIINNILIRQIILFYGKEIETNWDNYFQESPTSEIFSFVLHIVSIMIWLLVILNIFELNSWMQAGWVIGWLLAFLWFTANNWAPDIIAWLQLLHSKRIKQWDVIKIPEISESICWIKTISLTEVKLVDIITENAIVIRTSRFRDFVIENISTWIKNEWKDKFIQYIDLKIGYGESIENIEQLCIDIFTSVKERVLEYQNGDHSLINQKYRILKRWFEWENNLYVDILENGDHAVTYRFFYTLHYARSIVKIQNILNKELYKVSQERNIWLNTPLSISAVA